MVSRSGFWSWQEFWAGPPGGRTETGKEILLAKIVDTSSDAYPGLRISAEEGALAPDFEGDRVGLSEFRGKTVFPDFWASWCTPCVIMLPEMQEFLSRHESDGLVIISVNRRQSLEEAKNFLARMCRERTGAPASLSP